MEMIKIFYPNTAEEFNQIVVNMTYWAPDTKLSDLVNVSKVVNGVTYPGINLELYLSHRNYSVAPDKVIEEVLKGNNPIIGGR